MAGNIGDPFLRIPNNILELILAQLDEPMDVENVFIAYPTLRGRVMRNKSVWLMDRVLPFIYPRLAPKDVNACAKVCQRWKKAVKRYEDRQSSEFRQAVLPAYHRF